jgi:UDP-glucose 4-epimerase
MKIVITGANGFIAGELMNALKRKSYDVIGLDLNSKSPDVTICDFTDLDSLIKCTKEIDIIFHIGAIGDVYKCFENPPLAAKINVMGTANIMEAARQNGIKKVIYASTWEVYGKPLYEPMDENHPTNPDHPYNITKLAGERIVLSYDHLKNTPGLALRLATTYGPTMRENGVMPIFIKKALKKEEIVIHGDGNQTRQFNYIDDTVDGFIRAMQNNIHGEVFNLTSKEKTSIKDIANYIINKIPTKISFGESRPGDISPGLVTSEKAFKVLGWSANVSMENGLLKMIEYYERNQQK